MTVSIGGAVINDIVARTIVVGVLAHPLDSAK